MRTFTQTAGTVFTVFALVSLAGCQTPVARPPSPPMTPAEQWRNAEGQMVGAYIERGDIVGAARAEDFIYHMSHGQAGTPMPSLEALPETAAPLPEPETAPSPPAPQLDPWGGFGPPAAVASPPAPSLNCFSTDLGGGMTTLSCP